jgi:hypothetical protein
MAEFTATLTNVKPNYGNVEISILFDNGDVQIRRDYLLTKAEDATEEAIALRVEAEKENLNALYANAEILESMVGQIIGE